jgi:6-phosphofructokinase
MTTPSRPPDAPRAIRKVAILFAGGPAPAANAVISTAAAAFLRDDCEVVGILNGYSNLVTFRPDRPLQEGRDYIALDQRTLRRTRNTRGILIGTARTNPGESIHGPADLDDPAKTTALQTTYAALASIGVDALISIGGDDTLKTANKLKLFQDRLPEGSPRIAVVHVPKTIDNDYLGIDFTFGYFTAVETLANEILNLLADAEANRSYFIAETMGRNAGWLAYGAAIAGEASLVLSVEDLQGPLRLEETTEDGRTRPIMNIDKVVGKIVDTMQYREREKKPFGVFVLGEGLAEYLPESEIKGSKRDPHGNLPLAEVHLAQRFAVRVAELFKAKTGRERKVTGVQLGYEARCALPHAFDVMLGSQLGVGAYRALVEEGLDGVMVSVYGQLNLRYVALADLVDPATLITRVNFIKPGSDFHRLARFLETHVHD